MQKVNVSQALLNRELEKFFVVAEMMEQTGQQAMMPSSMVDSCWHDLIAAGEIDLFVENALGKGVRVEHLPNDGEGVLEWVEAYHSRFGTLQGVWFVRPDGTFDQEGFELYLSHGIYRAAWDCAPGIKRPRKVTVQ